MTIRKILILLISFSLYGCSDYKSGYSDGYDEHDKRQWLMFGKSEYMNGFHAGQAERFQQDWLIESPIAESLMNCPTGRLASADPLMFLPDEYNRIGKDIYQIGK